MQSDERRLLILNSQEPNVNDYLTQWVADGFRNVLGPQRVHVVRYIDAVRTLRQAQCDTLLVLGGQGMRIPIIKELLRSSATRVLWTFDDPYELSGNLPRAAWFDHVFTNDAGSVANYGDNATHMPLAAIESTDRPLPPSERDLDLFFSGVAWPNCVRTLRDLLPRLDGLNTRVFLPTNPLVAWPSLDLPEFQWNVRLCHADLLAMARRSKVVLYLDRDYSTNGSRSRATSPANRLFEIAGLGIAQVAIADEDTIAPYLEPGKEILVAADAEAGERQIRELLADPARIDALGEAARRRVQSEHTYAHRARAILETIEAARCATACREPESEHCGFTAGGSSTVVKQWHTAGQGHPAAAPAGGQRLRILMVSHGVRGQEPCGGPEVHVEFIERGLHDHFDFHLLYPRHRSSITDLVHRNCRSGEEHVVFSGPRSAGEFIHDEKDRAFQKLLHAEDIHLVHFVHLLHHSWSYIPIARALGRATILDLYDFFPVCERLNLLDDEGQYCDLPYPEQCDRCLGKLGLPAGTQARRRRLICEAFESVDRIRFLSQSHRALVERVLPVPADKVIVQGLGIPWIASPEQFVPSPPLRVVMLGHLANKSTDTILAVIQQLASEPIHFTLAGAIEGKVQKGLRRSNNPNVTLRDDCGPEQLASVLGGQHVALFASPWPEAFVLALSQAFRTGLVPVVPDNCTLCDRVRNGENGLVVRDETGAFLRALLSLLDDPRLLERLRQQALATPCVSVEDNLALMRGVYHDLAIEYHLPWASPPAVMEEDLLLPICTSHPTAAVGHSPPPRSTTIEKLSHLYRCYGAWETARRVGAHGWRRLMQTTAR